MAKTSTPYIERIRLHPGVDQVSDERQFDGGNVFVYLKPGFTFDFYQRLAGFDTVTEAYHAVCKVIPITDENREYLVD